MERKGISWLEFYFISSSDFGAASGVGHRGGEMKHNVANDTAIRATIMTTDYGEPNLCETL